MGRDSKYKQARRDERRVKAALEAAGVGERVRAAHLGLRREDVQADIKKSYESQAALADRLPLLGVARDALASRGYDLAGVEVTVKILPGLKALVKGEVVDLPPRAVFTADASPDAVEAARKTAGVRRPVFARAAAAPN